MHFDRLHLKIGWYSTRRDIYTYTQTPTFRILPFKQAEHHLSSIYSCILVETKKISKFLVI